MFNIFKSKKMDESEFWHIISLFDWDQEGDNKVIAKAIEYLSGKPNDQICEFYEIMSKLLYDLDGITYARNIGEESYVDEDSPFSVDWFLYARCVVIANGKNYYYKVLNNPDKMPKDLEFESLLYIAPEAFEKKSGKEFDYLPRVSFETFSNKEKWTCK